MLKILIISTNADESGAPRHVETLVKQLVGSYEFHVIFGETGPVANRLRDLGVDVYIVHGMRSDLNPISDFKSLKRIYRIVESVNPNIIHTHSAKASFLGRLCAKYCGANLVYTVHGWGWRGKSHLQAFVIWAVEFILARFCPAKYIYVAKDVESAAKKYLLIPASRGIVVYNGVSLFEDVVPFASDHSFVSFLMPARVSKAKDHETLFRAFEMLGELNYELVLCGEGTNKSEFIEKANKIAPTAVKKFKFFGQTSDVGQMYLTANVMLLISKFEALPLSIIEAMGCRKCIVATNIGGVPELIDHNINGILVEKENPVALNQALKRVFDIECRDRLSSQAFKKFERCFSAKIMGANTAKVYENHL